MDNIGRIVIASRAETRRRMVPHKLHGYGIRRVWHRQKETAQLRQETLTTVVARKIVVGVTPPQQGIMDPQVEEVHRTAIPALHPQAHSYATIFTVIDKAR